MNEPLGVAVSDSTPLIFLAKIGKPGLFKEVFGKIFIPKAVFNEAVTQGKALLMSDASIIEEAVGVWIIEELVKPEVDAEFRFLDENPRLGSGEKEALKLCKQLNAEYFIADDREARRVSKILSIRTVGTCGIVVQACRRSLITNVEALQLLDDLVKIGFRMSPTVYRRVMDELDSLP